MRLSYENHDVDGFKQSISNQSVLWDVYFALKGDGRRSSLLPDDDVGFANLSRKLEHQILPCLVAAIIQGLITVFGGDSKQDAIVPPTIMNQICKDLTIRSSRVHYSMTGIFPSPYGSSCQENDYHP
jgi:hypothetical protein